MGSLVGSDECGEAGEGGGESRQVQTEAVLDALAYLRDV